MKIRSISISGLFGTFDHHIPLFQREPITIIHGPNGVGKTSVLRLIFGALRPAYSHLRRVPFRDLTISFADDSELSVTRRLVADEDAAIDRKGARPTRVAALAFRLLRSGRVEHEYVDHGKAQSPRLLGTLERFFPFLDRVGPDEWLDRNSGTITSTDEVLQNYGANLPEEYRNSPEVPQWLQELQRGTPVHFIETQRLLSTKPVRPHSGMASHQSTVERCASEMADHVKSTLAKSATLSQSLERSFPARLISQVGPAPLTEDQIREQLANLDRRQARLVEAGLLDPGYGPALPAKRFDETTQRVLAVYIRDTEEKLAVFDDLLSRIELIKSIVDSRFLMKSVSVNRTDGFSVRTRDGRRVELSGLSSGEQHELVLLYELLFRAERHTLILIDEPELSLHIAWQQQFLRDLLQITKLANLQALLATHSPQIIHDRWDLTVELLGPSR